jgi:hypothetical protein
MDKRAMNTWAVRTWKRTASILVLVVTLLASAASARAQDTEVAAGISWVWLQGDYGRWHTYQGWSLELARSVTPHLSVVGEAGGNYYSVDYSNGWSESHRVYTFTAGPRVNTSRNDKVIGFVQLLAGVTRVSSTLRNPPEPDFNGSSSGFAIQPGGGVDVKVARRAAVRADLSAVVADPWHSISWQLSLWRLGLSGVYRW